MTTRTPGSSRSRAPSDNLIIDNVSYDNGDHGIDNYASTGQRILGNTVYHNVTAGINVEGGSAGATIANNVSVDNGIASPRTHSDIRVDSQSTSGTTMDYDLAYLTTPDTLLIWDSVNYTSLARVPGRDRPGAARRPGAIRSGSTRPGVTSTSRPARPRSTRPTRAWPASRASTSTATAVSTIR